MILLGSIRFRLVPFGCVQFRSVPFGSSFQAILIFGQPDSFILNYVLAMVGQISESPLFNLIYSLRVAHDILFLSKLGYLIPPSLKLFA